MNKRELGRGGPAVSAIGVGAMSFAGIYGETTEAKAHALLDAARDLGIDHVDTSNVYGMGVSETMIGAYLAKASDEPFRIATKAGITRDAETGARKFDNSKAHLEAELDASLKRLGVERVELFYIHRREPDRPIEEVTETLAGFVKAGKIGGFGFSEIAPATLRRAAAIHPVAAVQSEYSLWTRAPELGLVQACADAGAALVAFSPVGRGMLTDHPPSREWIENSAFLKSNPRFIEPNFSENLSLSERFRDLAADIGVPAAALAVAWLLSRDECVIPIPGTRSPDHLRELAAGAEITLSGEDLHRVERTLPVGWAHGDRYSGAQWIGPERYS